MTAKKSQKQVWQYPWRYKEGFLIALGLILAGSAIEVFTDNGITVPGWPVNLIIGVVFINLLTVIYVFFRKHPVVRWLGSAPAAIPSIAVVTLMTMIMGFIPQNSDKMPAFFSALGFTHVAKSWSFALAQIFFLTVLGIASLKHTSPLRGKNIGFLLNHAGLWIVIAAASLGTGDLMRLNMQLQEGGDFSNRAISSKNEQYQLRVALKLHDFKMELYNPRIAAIENNTYKVIREDGEKMPMVEAGLNVDMHNWQIDVLEYFDLGIPKDSTEYRRSKMMGAAPAAKIRATHAQTQTTRTGWISSGSFRLQPKLLQLNNNISLVLTNPEPKKYASRVEYITKDGKRDTVTIEVNKPLKINGWKVYQSSYDSSRGQWSRTSILELVNDPWLPVVYVGIFMMIAGAVYIFWIGRGK